VGETGTNVTTVTFGHRSGKLLATGSEDNTIHIYVIGQMTSLLVRLN
jgi:WD40 repeat protein